MSQRSASKDFGHLASKTQLLTQKALQKQ
jgi:hypothetical protein